MRRQLWRAVVPAFALLASTSTAVAQSPPACPRAYQPLRYDEDWSCLKDPAKRRERWDTLKHIPLGGERVMSIGGDARWRFERYENPGFGAGQRDRTGYFLQRYLVHADVRLSPALRAFAQVQSSSIFGRSGGARRSDLNPVDLHQAFIDVKAQWGRHSSLMVRGGRQEVEFGSSRLVSTRDGLNVRLSFDGIRLMAQMPKLRMWAFAMQPVEIDPGVFDDGRERRTMWGASIGNAPEPKPTSNVAVYFADLHVPDARYVQGAARERRLTLGVRAWGADDGWDYNLEPIFQWGRFGAGRILAWAVASDVGRSWPRGRLRPRIGIRADVASGDRDPGDTDLQTFNPLFAGVPYSGLAGLVGPSNVWDVTPSLAIRLRPDLALTAGAAFFSRTSEADGIYSINLGVERSGAATRGRFVGSQGTVQVAWSPTAHVTANATVSYFNTGPLLRETPPARDVLYTTAFVTYRF